MKSIKSIRIPDGIVSQLKLNGVVLWKQNVLEQLTAPTITLDGDTLTMTTTDERTKQFVIFVDGVETAVVENEKEGTYTISGTWQFNKTLSLPDTRIYQLVDYKFSNGYEDGGFNIRPTEVVLCDSYTNNATMYTKTEGWSTYKGKNFCTITFDGVQTVGKEFYDWLVANATRPISGIYKFSDLYDIHDLGFNIDLNFTSNGQTFTNINGDSAGTYYDDTLVWKVNNNWVSENYQYIEIVGTQYLYYWDYCEIMAVATKVFAFTIDGTTYYAKEDMTWGEWVESEYNTGVEEGGTILTYFVDVYGGSYIDGTNEEIPIGAILRSSHGGGVGYVVRLNGVCVLNTDTIIPTAYEEVRAGRN